MINKLLRQLGHQEYLRFGVRDKVIRTLRNPDKISSNKFTVPFFGKMYTGNLNSFLDWSVYFYGAYSIEELRLISDLLEPIEKPVVFDVGANIGHHSLFISSLSNKVFAFEPYELVRKQIEEKITLNNITNIEICSFGLSDINCIKDYYSPINANTGTGSFLGSSNIKESIKLELRKGDDFVKEKQIKKIDLIKMDVEGYEPLALLGLNKTLKEKRPLVFFEWTENSRKTCNKNIINDLFPEDYIIYQFISDIPIFKIFRKNGYSLTKTQNVWIDGNLLAIPLEYLEMLNKNHPNKKITINLK